MHTSIYAEYYLLPQASSRLLALDPVLPDGDEGGLAPGADQARGLLLLNSVHVYSLSVGMCTVTHLLTRLHLLSVAEVGLGPGHAPPLPPELVLSPLGLGQLRLDLVQHIPSLPQARGAHRRRHFWHGLQTEVSSKKFLLNIHLVYLVDLGLSERDYCVPVREFEGVDLALVVDEVLHDARFAPGRQDAGPVQGGVELAESVETV